MKSNNPSPLRWVGGKARLLPTIKQYLPKTFNNYFEVFFGGGSLYFDFGFQAKKQVFINDINIPLMTTYKMLATSREELLTRVEKYGNFHYDAIKHDFNERKDSLSSGTELDLAALFICLNAMCFNGVYRENKKGKFNVPVGKNSKGIRNTCDNLDYERLRYCGRLLEGRVTMTHQSFDPWPFPVTPGEGDVVFNDPAYLKEFSQYNKSGFTAEDHKTLNQQALTHASNGATVIVCGSNNDASKAIYGDPTIVVELSRTIGHSKRKKATEALWVWNGVK